MEEESIDLKDLFGAIKRNVFIIIAFTLICMVAVFAVTKFGMTPKYNSTGQISIKGPNVAECTSALKSDIMLESVIENLRLRMTTDDLKNLSVYSLRSMITVTAVSNTSLYNVSVVSADPLLAKNIIEEIFQCVPEKLGSILTVSTTAVISSPSLPTSPISPSIKKNIIIAAFLGIIISCAVFVMLEIFKKKIRKENDLPRGLGVIVLGAIPTISDKSKEVKRNAQ